MGELTQNRCMTLLRNVIDVSTISKLLQMGFTTTELVENFHFDRNDVRDAAIELQNGEMTFRSLQNVIDFTDANFLKCIEGFDWAIEVGSETDKSITIYQYVSNNNCHNCLFKRLILHFVDPDMVELIAFAPFRKEPVKTKTVSVYTPLRSTQWTVGVLGHFETEWSCAEMIAHYTELLQKAKQEGE